MTGPHAGLYDIAPLLELEMAKFRLWFIACTALPVRELAPAFRSRLGLILKRRFCPFPDYESRFCKACDNERACLYIQLFSPSRRTVDPGCKGRGKSHGNPPRPYALDVFTKDRKENIRAGEAGCLELTLFGDRAIGLRRPMFESLYHAALSLNIPGRGLENNKRENTPLAPRAWQALMPEQSGGAWQLAAKDDTRLPTGYPGAPLAYWIRTLPALKPLPEFVFRTPVQLSRGAGSLSFTVLLQSIIARLRDLKRIYHLDNDMGSFPGIFYQLADRVAVLPDLKKVTFDWYSVHREKSIPLGGLRGSLVFKGDVGPFVPVLGAGFFIGMGKKTVYGLGRYTTPTWDIRL